MKRQFLYTFLFILFVSCKTKSENSFSNESNGVFSTPFSAIKWDDIFSEDNTNQDSLQKTKDDLDLYYKKYWEGSDLSGGFLVAKGDQILYEKYRGYGRENQQMPITEKTPLHVASISKTLTAMVILKLVESGKIHLDDPFAKYFPGFPYPKVTIKTMLNHRSGLPKYEYFIPSIQPAPAVLNKKFITNKDVLQLLIQYKPELSKETNAGFMYCNTNYSLLALLIEKISKMPFPKAMHDLVFAPLKMDNSFIFQEKDTATASQSFYYRGNRLYPTNYLDLIYGDKNVYTTPRDLLQFSKAMYAPNFLKKELMDAVFTPYSNEKFGTNNYGLGFRMKIFDNNEKLTYHTGWWHGSNGVFAHLLRSKVTIIAIGNKYSQQVYSSLMLSGLFENFPLEKEKLTKAMQEQPDSIKTESEMHSE